MPSFVAPPLITASQVLAALNLSAADQARVPGQVIAASRYVRGFCGRFFTRRPDDAATMLPLDIVITPPLRGDILVPEYPINDVLRCSSSKTTVFSVSNTDPTTNQRAICKLTRAGGEIQGWTTTGLYLERWAAGVNLNTTILFSSLGTPTIGALVEAVNGEGGGWTASAAGSDTGGDDYSLWPVSELRYGQGSLGALQDDAEFQAWVEDVEIERDDEAGIIRLVRGDDNPFTSLRWGPTAGLEFGDEQIRGSQHGIRLVLDAGYETIPEDLADAVVEVTKAMLERKATSTTVQSERTDTWTIVNREMIHALPTSARDTLARYRSHAR